MKTIKQTQFLLLLGLILGISACQSDDDAMPQNPGPQLPSYILEESAFGCTNYQTVMADVGFQINHSLLDQNFLVFGGFDSLVVTNASNNNRLISEAIGVNELLVYNNKIMVCADEGLFEIDDTPTVMEKSPRACRDMLLTSSGELLITLDNSINDINRIHKWEEAQGLQQHTTPHSLPCINIDQLAEAANGDIWAVNCDGFVMRFRDGAFLDFFDENAIPRTSSWNGAAIFLKTYGEDMVLAVKNGTGRYQILKFRDGEWLTLFDKSLDGTTTEQESEMLLPSLERAIILDDKLFIATTLASCRGIHVFDITKNEQLQAEDYYVVKDPGLEGQCINDISLASSGDILVTTLGNDVTIMDCN